MNKKTIFRSLIAGSQCSSGDSYYGGSSNAANDNANVTQGTGVLTIKDANN